jgi:ankyrin repeat protein
MSIKLRHLSGISLRLCIAHTALLLVLGNTAWAVDTLPDLVNSGKHSEALAMIAAGTDVNEQSEDGTTGLHWAVYQKDADLVRRFLAEGADPNITNDYGASPATVASEHGEFEIMEALLDAGGDRESPNAEGQTLLMAVARTGRTDTAQLLLERGADVNARESWGGQTSLMWASSQQQPAMVTLLLEHGANPDDRSKEHNWPRWVTSEPRNKSLDPGGFTPLLYAAREGCQSCVEALLDHGADIDLTDLNGQTPLIMAMQNLHYDTANLLIDRGADIHRWDWFGRTALYSAIDLNLLPSSRRGDLPSVDRITALDLARTLLEQGAYVDMRLKKEPPFRGGDRGYTDGSPDSRVLNGGATALHKAAKAGDIEAVKLLLEFDARVDIANMVYEVTPILAAAGVWRVYGIFMETPISGVFTTAEEAAQVMQLLLDAGADIHERGANGQNVAHGSAKAGWNAALELAYDQGVDFSARDVGGYTPRDLALNMGHIETVELIDQLLGDQ